MESTVNLDDAERTEGLQRLKENSPRSYRPSGF